jgi:lysyl-tRNA synthetase class 2
LEFEPLDQFHQRKKNLEEIQALGYDGYPHEFRWTATVAELAERYGQTSKDDLDAQRIETRVAGRMVTLRLHGKAGFAHIQGGGKQIQIYVKLDVVGEKTFRLFQLLDMGDSVGVAGHVFRTKTNELTLWVEQLTLLAKALLPLPEKWHGLADVERRYRQRYLDLIANEKAREVFVKRAKIVGELRSFFNGRGYMEVETPMMQPLAGGATARPFVTHHNALDVDLYLRIAPELYLKRLVVGGLDRVYEINRNFRNEGISTQHNPEFTMLEFYEAYSNYRDLMDLTEELLSGLAQKVCGSTVLHYGQHQIDFGRWQRLSMHQAIGKYWPNEAGSAPTVDELREPGGPRRAAVRYDVWAAHQGQAAIASGGRASRLRDGDWTGLLFEGVAEGKLIQPTILYDFPIEISPLSKQKPDDPSLVERFEVFVAGMEIGNAFSELNDPVEQERRFRQQIDQGGEEVPKHLDIDYIRALAHGMPPAAGMGIGIDRLTMLFTDSHSIREVILFPLLRPEAGPEQRAGSTGECQ